MKWKIGRYWIDQRKGEVEEMLSWLEDLNRYYIIRDFNYILLEDNTLYLILKYSRKHGAPSEQCEWCGKDHDTLFGSGRYCSRSCANSRNRTKRI